MSQLRYGKIAVAVLLGAAVILSAGLAAATPIPTGAKVCPRVFNDDPFSTLTVVNNYPSLISFDDVKFNDATGGANLHVWRYTVNGTDVDIFNNPDNFRVCADLVISGTGECEAGLQVVPWWNLGGGSCGVDGRINIRTTDGEMAAFGGRLPFASWTNPCCNPGGWTLSYVKGTPIHLEIIYMAHSNTAADPGTIEYRMNYLGNDYNIGPVPMDEGNPSEDPPHGVWGILSPAAVGGHMQYFVAGSPNGGNAHAEWSNICFEALDPVPVKGSTWGNIKALMQ